MAVIKFKQNTILNAVVCLLSAFFVFNAEYPKAGNGQTKNIYLFLDQLLKGRTTQFSYWGGKLFILLIKKVGQISVCMY